MDIELIKKLISLSNSAKSSNHTLANGADGVWIRLTIINSDPEDSDVGEKLAICLVLLPAYPQLGDEIGFNYNELLCHETRIPYNLIIDNEEVWPKIYGKTIVISKRTMVVEGHYDCIGYLSV